jgi:hypothetical protein
MLPEITNDRIRPAAQAIRNERRKLLFRSAARENKF